MRKSLTLAALCVMAAMVVVIGTAGTGTAAPAPIKIMVTAPVQAAAYAAPEIPVNVKAAVDGINKRGGINGVKVQLSVCDNGNNPNKAAQCAQQAVKDKVVAMVGNYSFLAIQAAYPILEKAKIPSIGNGPGAPMDWTSPMSFPVSYSTQAYVAGPPVAMARNGCKKISSVGFDDPAYDPYFAIAKAGIAYAKVKNTGDVRFPGTTTDFTATVQTALQKGADCIFTLGPPPTVPGLLRAMKNSGKKIRLGGLTDIAGNLPGLGKALDGSALVQPTPTPTLNPPKSAPAGLKLYAQDIKASGKATARNMNDNGFDAWIGARFFYDLASSLPKGKVTSAALIKAGNKFHFTMPGVVGDSDFSKPAPMKSAPRVHNQVMYTKVIKNGKTSPTGKVDLTPLVKKLG